MEWFRKLLQDKTSAPRPVPTENEKSTSVTLDWTEIENRLVAYAEAEITRFVAKHTDEVFYGFGFDCNAEYGQVLLCLNSRAGLIEVARERYPDRPQDKTVAAIEWGLGDWLYPGFGDVDYWQAWEDAPLTIDDTFEDLLETDQQDNATVNINEAFLEMVCRALRRVEKGHALTLLKREPDFRVLCVDHDEDAESGFARLAKFN